MVSSCSQCSQRSQRSQIQGYIEAPQPFTRCAQFYFNTGLYGGCECSTVGTVGINRVGTERAWLVVTLSGNYHPPVETDI